MDHNRPQKTVQKFSQVNMSPIEVPSWRAASLHSLQIQSRMGWMRYALTRYQNLVSTIYRARIYLDWGRSNVDPDGWHKEVLEWPCLLWQSFKAKWADRVVIKSKRFIHIRIQCHATTPNCGRTLQTRWDRGLKTESFISKDLGFQSPLFYGRTGNETYITAFKKGSVAKTLHLMGSPSIGKDSSSSCLRRCW
jgi:hypothetical protein